MKMNGISVNDNPSKGICAVFFGSSMLCHIRLNEKSPVQTELFFYLRVPHVQTAFLLKMISPKDLCNQGLL